VNPRPATRTIRFALIVVACLSLGCVVIEALAPRPTESDATEAPTAPQPTPTEALTPVPPTATLEPEPPDEPAPPVQAGVFGPFAVATPQPPAGAVLDLRAASDGALWLTTDEGLSVLRAGAWTHLSPEPVILLGFDNTARAWTADETGDQVTVWSGQTSRTLGADAGWTPAGTISRNPPYTTVSDRFVIDGRGWSWIATRHDVRAFDGERWRVFAPEDAGFTPSDDMVEMGFGYRFRDVAVDSTGDVWVTDCAWAGPGPIGQGARWYNGTTWEGQTSSVVGSGCIEAIEVDAAGRIWVAVDGDLWRYTPGQGWEEFAHPDLALPEPLRWGYIVDLTLGGGETAWVTMAPCGGASCDVGVYLLFRIREGSWTQISDAGMADLALDRNGDGWLCVGNALYQVSEDEPALIHEGNDSTCRLEVDVAGQTWLWQPGTAGLWVTGGD
jgi:hypothetical protein